MKLITCILFISIFGALPVCNAQVRDSVCMHIGTTDNWQRIRAIDSAGYNAYMLNTKHFREKFFRRDSLLVKLTNNDFLPATVFIGEYTTRDSIHFIDFMQVNIKPMPQLCFEGISNKYISRDQLPLLHKLTFCNNSDSFKIKSYDLYIQHDSGYSTFRITAAEFSAEIKNSLMRLKQDQYIAVDNVHVITPHDGIRVFEGRTFQIKD